MWFAYIKLWIKECVTTPVTTQGKPPCPPFHLLFTSRALEQVAFDVLLYVHFHFSQAVRGPVLCIIVTYLIRGHQEKFYYLHAIWPHGRCHVELAERRGVLLYHFYTNTVLVLALIAFSSLITTVLSSGPAHVHTGQSGTDVPNGDCRHHWRALRNAQRIFKNLIIIWSGIFANSAIGNLSILHIALFCSCCVRVSPETR